MAKSSKPTTSASRRPRPYAGKSAQERQQERKKQLVDAAVVLFGDHGFAATTIDAVCAEACLTKRYFYEAFESREALLTASYQTATQDFLGHILKDTTPQLKDAKQLVRTGLESTFGFVKANPHKARLIMVEAMAVRGHLGNVYGDRYDDFVGLLLDFTRPFLTKPAPPEREFRVIAKGMVGAIMHLCQNWIATNYKQPIEELVNGMEHIMTGVGVALGVRGY